MICLASQGSAGAFSSIIWRPAVPGRGCPSSRRCAPPCRTSPATSTIWANWRSRLSPLPDVAGVDAVLRQRLGTGRKLGEQAVAVVSGSRRPAARRCPCGQAARGCAARPAAASGVLTVMRTSSRPAIASSFTWMAVRSRRPCRCWSSTARAPARRRRSSPPRAPGHARPGANGAAGRAGSMKSRLQRFGAACIVCTGLIASSMRATLSRAGRLSVTGPAAEVHLRRRGVADREAERRSARRADHLARLQQARQPRRAAPSVSSTRRFAASLRLQPKARVHGRHRRRWRRGLGSAAARHGPARHHRHRAAGPAAARRPPDQRGAGARCRHRDAGWLGCQRPYRLGARLPTACAGQEVHHRGGSRISSGAQTTGERQTSPTSRGRRKTRSRNGAIDTLRPPAPG